MSADVLLLRHGTTTWNASGRIQGWTDVELADAGRAEAAAVADAVAEAHDVTRVVGSPLRRAGETAEIVADRTGAGPVVRDPGWRERSFGALEGESADVVFDAYPEIHPGSPSFSLDEAPPGGESVATVVERVRDSWRTLVAEHRGGVVVVVTHETPLRLAAGFVDGVRPVEALRRHSFEPGDALAVSGLAAASNAEWGKFYSVV